MSLTENCQVFNQGVLNREIEAGWSCAWIGATFVKTSEAGRIVSVAVGVNTEVQRDDYLSIACLRDD